MNFMQSSTASSMDDMTRLWTNESIRQQEFPVCADKIFLAHAAVAPITKAALDAETGFAQRASRVEDDYEKVLLKEIHKTRVSAAALLENATPEETALLGPTSLGLSLVASGLSWNAGDEVVYYQEDYPANVYPWLSLQRFGVVPREVKPQRRGEITPELVEQMLTPKTRLVALASANFVSGYRIDLEAIGKLLAKRGILFCVDAIQTLGAFPINVEHIDFLSADAHKWMLGPLAAGIVYVKKSRFEELYPALLGASNVKSPNFVAQTEIQFPNDASRYEPGVLNLGPLLGMRASIDLFLKVGKQKVTERVQMLVKHLADGLKNLGFEPLGPTEGPNASGILTVSHKSVDMQKLYESLESQNIIPSLRKSRTGEAYIRFSPHFYNTERELDAVLEVVRGITH